MPSSLTETVMDLAIEGVRSGIGWAAIHDGDPGESGTDNALGFGAEIVWGDPVDWAFDLELPLQFAGLLPGQSVEWVSLWTAEGGAHCGNIELLGELAANGFGEFSITAISIDLNQAA